MTHQSLEMSWASWQTRTVWTTLRKICSVLVIVNQSNQLQPACLQEDLKRTWPKELNLARKVRTHLHFNRSDQSRVMLCRLNLAQSLLIRCHLETRILLRVNKRSSLLLIKSKSKTMTPRRLKRKATQDYQQAWMLPDYSAVKHLRVQLHLLIKLVQSQKSTST